jgi:hypothetical protein
MFRPRSLRDNTVETKELVESNTVRILSGVFVGAGVGKVPVVTAVGEGVGEEVMAVGLGVGAGVSAVGPGVGDSVSKIKSALQLNSELPSADLYE